MNTQDKLKLIQDAEKAAVKFVEKRDIPSQDITGVKLVQYWYFKTLESFAKKEKDKAIKFVTEEAVVENNINDLVKETQLLQEGQTGIVAKSGTLALTCKTKKGARRFDVATLTTKLLTEHRMSAVKVEALIESCYKTGNPSKEYDVEEI